MTAAAVIERLDERDLLGLALAICKRFHVRLEDAASLSRQPSVIRARHAIWRALRELPTGGLAYAEIGRLWKADHKTIMHAVRKGALPGENPGASMGNGEGADWEQPGSGLGRAGAEHGDSDGGSSRALASRAHSESGSSYSQLSNLKGNSEASSSCLREQAREGEEVKEEHEVLSETDGGSNLKVKPNGSTPLFELADEEPKERKRKPAERPIPDKWAPTPQHYLDGKERGLLKPDVDREAECFRAHAEAHDRRCVRWDAAFRQWLLKAKPTTVAQRNGRPELPGRHRTRDESEPHTMTYREFKEEPGATGGPPSGDALKGMLALVGRGGVRA